MRIADPNDNPADENNYISYVSMTEAKRIMGVSSTSIHAYRRRGLVRSVEVGDRIHLSESDLYVLLFKGYGKARKQK